ncbi:hypothetical protein [Peribacillus kribbensis]|nr:hypothetical protein [Peribacillus kribbensis]
MKKEKDKGIDVDRDEGRTRTFFGSPTIGGLIIISAIILYFIFN